MKENTVTEDKSPSDFNVRKWSFWLWLVGAVSLLLIVSVVVSAWAVRHVLLNGGVRFSETQTRAALAIAEFPGHVIAAMDELRFYVSDEPLSLLLDRNATQKSNWVRRFPAPEDTGYLLFSGVDPVLKRSVVKLIRIADGKTLANWSPDWRDMFRKYQMDGSSMSVRAMHPLLLDNADIIFNVTGPLIRVSACNSKIVWLQNVEEFHHSVELDENNEALWVPSVSHDGLSDNSWLQNLVRDDALAHVSLEGKLLEKLSFARILRENGLQAMMLATSGDETLHDPIHLNQIAVARSDSKYWHRGDLLISARHLSTVFLYRPSTGKILWYQTGPWMNQHSADFVDDHRISVFNNNVISVGKPEHGFMKADDTNQVLLYDFDTKQISQPYAKLLAESRPITFSEGRARVLPDGGLFFEETNYGRHLRFSKDRLLWSRLNDYDDARIGMLSWSRYLTAEEVKAPLRALATMRCTGGK